MNILIIGNGGREHALAWKAAQSPLATKVFVAPGNAGTALESKVENVDIDATDIGALIFFAQTQAVELTIVGPEVPLALGIVDQFSAHHLACFGPTKACAQLESSKQFSKDFMREYGIPTARYATFTDMKNAIHYLKTQSFPIVIKADGLAAGKGVIIAQNEADAIAAATSMLSDARFGDAGQQIVIEAFLSGIEASFIVMCDGEHALPLASSQDHKARDDGDHGPNTGGMGAYSPAPMVTPEIEQRILQEVIKPTLKGMKKRGTSYTGFLYAGLMIGDNGELNVLEFNCRMGDPETQPLMMRLESDLIELCQAALNHKLDSTNIQWRPETALGVVMASQGYPDSYPKGDTIEGLRQETLQTKIFHAGTMARNNSILTHGGRVLCVVSLGDTIDAAQQQAYSCVKTIHWGNEFYRTDIGESAKRFFNQTTA